MASTVKEVEYYYALVEDKPGEARKLLEESLRKLQVDKLDLWQLHNVQRQDQVDQIFASDGAIKALEKARTHLPDLVILDVMMPKIDDGIQTYEQFRTDQKLSHIPIIMLSAIAKKTFVHSIRMLRPWRDARIPEPEAYMEKPPDADELSKLISELLPKEN